MRFILTAARDLIALAIALSPILVFAACHSTQPRDGMHPRTADALRAVMVGAR